MDAMTLVAKLTLNDSEFRTGLKESEKYAEGGQKGLNKWGVMFGNLWTKGVTLAVRAVKNFGVSVVKTGMDFDAAMSQVKALGQLEGDDFDKVRAKAMELGATTKFTASEVADGFAYMALAGWDADEMLEGITGILNLAAASGEDLGTVSDIVTDALTAFGLEASDASHFVDVLAQASANSNTTVSMMGEAFKYLATTGGVLGYSIEDVAIALGLIANNGIKAGQAGTSMRQVLNTLINPTDKAAEAMEKLGISLFEPGTDKRIPLLDVIKNMRKVFQESDFNLEGQSLEDAAEKINEIDEAFADVWDFFEKNPHGKYAASSGNLWSQEDAEKAYTAAIQRATGFNEEFLGALGDIGGLRGIGTLLALMKSSDEDFDSLVEKVYNSEGAAGEMAKTMLDNLMGDITILNSALDNLKILLSGEFREPLREFIQMITEEIGALSQAFEEGGLAGMFTNLANWIVNGITGALTDDSITVDAANDFGKAIGDFVGKLIAKLITNAPEIISGLFEAGLNLAGGLIEGLFAGLFGAGEGTVYGILSKAEDERNDTIAEANATAAEAQGIVSYMQSLVDKYGEAAKESGEWADALARLEQLIPGITTAVSEEGEALGLTTQAYREYIEEQKKKLVQDAKDAYVAEIRKKYEDANVALGKAQVNEALARYQQEEAIRAIAEKYLEAYKNMTPEEVASLESLDVIRGMGLTDADSIIAAINDGRLRADYFFDTAKALIDDEDTYEALKKSYDEAVKAQEENAASIKTLSESADTLQQQLIVAEAAAQRMAEEMAGFTVPEFFDHAHGGIGHAKGLWSVPFDDYPALLHRNEMVLTASQARRYREGGMQIGDMSAVISDAVKAAVGQMAIILNDKAVGRTVGDSVSPRVGTNLAAQNRRVNYGYGS